MPKVPQKITNPAPFSQQNIKKNRYLKKVINYLEKVNLELKGRDKAKYETIKHRTVYTAFDKAATLRVKPNLIGKTIILKANGNLAVILIPGNRNLDKNKFKKTARVKKTDFASEKLIKNRLKGVKVGAIPPFGDLWKLPTFIDRGLFNNPKIIINSGDYNFSIKISPANLKKMTPNLTTGNFSKARR